MEERGKGGGIGIPGSPDPTAPKAPSSMLATLMPRKGMRAVPLGTSGTAFARSAEDNFGSGPVENASRCVLRSLALRAS